MSIGFNMGRMGWSVMTPISGSGAPMPVSDLLMQWLEGGTEGVTFTQATDSVNPIQVTDLATLKSNPCVKFDGVGDKCSVYGISPTAVEMWRGLSITAKVSAIGSQQGIFEIYEDINNNLLLYVDPTGNLILSTTINVLGQSYTADLTGIDITQAHTYKIVESTIYLELWIDGVYNGSINTGGNVVFNVVNINVGGYGTDYFNGYLSNFIMGSYVFPMGDVASGSINDRSETISIPVSSSTSGKVAMSARQDDMPALSTMYGGNLYTQWEANNVCVLDTVLASDHGQFNIVETTFEITARVPVVMGNTKEFCGIGLNRRMGAFNTGEIFCGSPGSPLCSNDLRGTGFHTFKGRMINGVGAQMPEREVWVDGVQTYSNLNDQTNTIYPLNQDLNICVGAFKPTDQQSWNDATGSTLKVTINDMTTSVVDVFEYVLLFDGTWQNKSTGQIFTPTNPSSTFIAPQSLVDGSKDVNGMLIENYPKLLTKLGGSISQTSATFDGSVNFWNPTGSSKDAIVLDAFHKHVADGRYVGQQNYNGSYGLWVDIDFYDCVNYYKQFPLTNNLLPADVDALEIEFNCVGDSGAMRDVDSSYILDVDGYVVFDTYL